MGGKLACVGDQKFMHNTRKPEGKRPQTRFRHRWVNNIKMDVK
jgi:hypothetical protein